MLGSPSRGPGAPLKGGRTPFSRFYTFEIVQIHFEAFSNAAKVRSLAMHPRLIIQLVLALSMTVGAKSEEDCAPKFRDYGFFLQAKKSCGKEVDYPLMAIMKACAKQTPEQTAINLMNEGRRAWAKALMLSNLGNMCEEALSKFTDAPKKARRR